jgi:BMFP domain-containing protein YqiC
MDLVPREEFDAVKAMAQRAREEQEHLTERVLALETALARLLAETAGKPSDGDDAGNSDTTAEADTKS